MRTQKGKSMPPASGMSQRFSWECYMLQRQTQKLDNKAEEQYTRGIQNVCSLKEQPTSWQKR